MSERYNYYEEMYKDVKEWINDNFSDVMEHLYNDTIDDFREYLHESMYCDDSVTGNASGSYFVRTWEAEEAICHNWYIIQDMVNSGFIPVETLTKGAETIDVCIRCYLLYDVIVEAICNTDLIDEANKAKMYA